MSGFQENSPMNADERYWSKIETLQKLPTLPHLLLKILHVCNEQKGHIKDLAGIIDKDPSLSMTVLRMANSPYYGLSCRVKNIQQAITILGTNTIRNIALCSSVQGIFANGKESPSFNLKGFWRHSLKCAVLARRIALKTNPREAEEAFLCGLLHDMGRLVLWTNFGERYTMLLEACENSPSARLKAEAELVADHCEIGAWLLRRWNFPSFEADAVLYHHEPANTIKTALPLAQAVYAANAFCQPSNEDAEEIAKTILGLSGAALEECRYGADEEVKAIAQALNLEIDSPDEGMKISSATDKKAREDLSDQIRQFSLLFGTLQNVLEAEDQESLLKAVRQGMQIVLDAEPVVFFLRDSKREWLTGRTFAEDRNGSAINHLRIPTAMKGSLLNRCLSEGALMNSFEESEDYAPVTADDQIVRFLGKEGMACLPMCSRGEEIGVIVIGLNRAELTRLTRQAELLRLFSAHAAAALHVDQLKRTRFSAIQSERLKAFSTFSRKVVHEVNTPLSIIKNYLSVLMRKLAFSHSVHDELTFISEEMDRVTEILHGLSDFSKSATLTMGPLNLNELLSELTSVLIKSGLLGDGITLHLNPDPALPPIQTDKNKVKQILINLLRNAVEAMPRGGNIFVRTRYAKNELHGAPLNERDARLDYAELSIRDDGPGIPAPIRSKIFEPFITTKGTGHSGLGLSIVFNLVQELQGTIACESKNGTAFTILWPFQKK